jgi:signal peptidase II
MDRSRKWLLVGIVLATVALDQGSKEWALDRLSSGRRIALVPTVELDLTFNSGFSFGTGAGNGRLIGVLVALVAVGLGAMIAREPRRARAATLAVILGGALGNLIDRVFRGDSFLSGEVVDFIDVSWYAVFNVADIFVVCGCLVLVAMELQKHKADRVGSTRPDA